jgi:hypothetical protein
MIDLTKEALLTVGGVAAFVLLVTQLLVKPAAKKYKEQGWYDIGINVISVILGIGGAILAQAAIGPIEFASALDAALTGFSGAAVAVLGYEGATNALAYVGSR